MPKMIGSQADAAIAAEVGASHVMPRGWSLAGTGCSRRAYRSPSGVIYKVAYNNDDNVNEHVSAGIMRRRKVPEGWAIPKTALYTVNGRVILAMQDCGDKGVHLAADQKQMVRSRFGVYDPHDGNIRFHEGTYFCIDFGFSNLVETRKARAKEKALAAAR